MNYTILPGDCLQVLRMFPDCYFDSIVTDPPYGLSLMGRKWDYDVPSTEVWAECLRVLKPGGHLLAFAGTRTQHRMAVRIEDAGFEIRDMIAWVYGSGFNKVGYVRDDEGEHVIPGFGGSLKPALEPITMARKPMAGTLARNMAAHGTGALNIDGCRVEPTGESRERVGEASQERRYTENGGTNFAATPGVRGGDPAGRWPANLILSIPEDEYYLRDAGTGSAARFFYQVQKDDSLQGEGVYNGAWQDQNQTKLSAHVAASSSSLQSVLDATVQSAAATWPSLVGILSSDSTGPSTSATPSESKLISEAVTAAILPIAFESSLESLHEKHSPCGSRVNVAATKSQTGTTTITASLYRSGGFVARATSSITPTSLDHGGVASRLRYCAKASRKDRGEGNTHPTVKPTDLMRYLCRLVTPPGGVVLDPFMGSGSTGKAAILEGFRFVGIEREAEYVEIARARIAGANHA